MKALIFNSGVGKRMGELTQNTHKALAVLHNGETILERQVRILSECGIKEFIITTGPYEEKLKAVLNRYPMLTFKLVHNDLYDKTNYIYSFYLTKEYLDDDFLVLHGDLVFNKRLIVDILKNNNSSIGLINKNIEKPAKDFKARVLGEEIKEVGINIFDSDCFAFQPLYKLSKNDVNKWWNRVKHYIDTGIKGVYAENALNDIACDMSIKAMEYDKYFIDEIDNPHDYERVVQKIRAFDFNEQEISESLAILETVKNPLVVVSRFAKDKFNGYKTFSDFRPNPLYEDVLKGVEKFKDCESIISIGGGSAIDVAKAIKYYSCLDANGNFVYKNIKHIAVPATAGTGSESTRYAVIYINGKKNSLTHDALFPDMAVLDADMLKSLPAFQKKCTLLDALCHSIESIWSVNATDESIAFAQKAITLLKNNYKRYVHGDHATLKPMLYASNLAGRAINISQTTAAHAMGYKLTTLFGLPHGLAVALTLPWLWELLSFNKCEKLAEINITREEFVNIFQSLELDFDIDITDENLEELTNSVNSDRLSNFPIELTTDMIRKIYTKLK